jgi:hypothetical protein
VVDLEQLGVLLQGIQVEEVDQEVQVVVVEEVVLINLQDQVEQETLLQ